MPEFEQHFCGMTRYRAGIATALSRTPNCGILIDRGMLRVVNDSTEQELLNVAMHQIGYSVPKVQGKVGSVAIHVENKKFLVDFGMVHRAETGRSNGSIPVGREIGSRFLNALRAGGAQPA